MRLKLQINNMPIINNFIEVQTSPGINIHNITPQIKDLIASAAIKNGQVLVFSRHTTTALAIIAVPTCIQYRSCRVGRKARPS